MACHRIRAAGQRAAARAGKGRRQHLHREGAVVRAQPHAVCHRPIHRRRTQRQAGPGEAAAVGQGIDNGRARTVVAECRVELCSLHRVGGRSGKPLQRPCRANNTGRLRIQHPDLKNAGCGKRTATAQGGHADSRHAFVEIRPAAAAIAALHSGSTQTVNQVAFIGRYVVRHAGGASAGGGVVCQGTAGTGCERCRLAADHNGRAGTRLPQQAGVGDGIGGRAGRVDRDGLGGGRVRPDIITGAVWRGERDRVAGTNLAVIGCDTGVFCHRQRRGVAARLQRRRRHVHRPVHLSGAARSRSRYNGVVACPA